MCVCVCVCVYVCALVNVCVTAVGTGWRSGSQRGYQNYHKARKFDARFYHLVFEEKIGQVNGHFGPINSLAFHPDGKRWALIRVELALIETSFQFQLQQWRGGWLCGSAHL